MTETWFVGAEIHKSFDAAAADAVARNVHCIDCVASDGSSNGSALLVRGQWRFYQPQEDESELEDNF